MPRIPVRNPLQPVMISARLGEQSGQGETARVKTVPRRTRSSRCGVSTCRLPRAATVSDRWSSLSRNSTLGRGLEVSWPSASSMAFDTPSAAARTSGENIQEQEAGVNRGIVITVCSVIGMQSASRVPMPLPF